MYSVPNSFVIRFFPGLTRKLKCTRQAEFFRKHTGMFRGMAVADDDTPPFPTDLKFVAVADAPDAAGYFRDDAREKRPAFAELGEIFWATSSAVVMCYHGVREVFARIDGQHSGIKPLLARHPKFRTGLFHKPACHADVIGMKMRADDPSQGTSVEAIVKHIAPLISR